MALEIQFERESVVSRSFCPRADASAEVSPTDLKDEVDQFFRSCKCERQAAQFCRTHVTELCELQKFSH